MKTYARIQNALVAELLETDGNIVEMFHPSIIWVEISNLNPMPAIGWSYANGLFTAPPPPSIEKLRADKAADIEQACRDAIYAGFTSNALGTVHHYPAKDKDQSNLVGSVTESLYPNLSTEWVTPFWCATLTADGEWAYRLHSAAQIQQVGMDAKAAIVAALTYNAQLQAQIAVADAEGLEAIVWNPPA